MQPFGQLVELPASSRQPLKISLVLTSVITLVSVTAVFLIQPQIPIFYSLPQASQQLVPRIWILLFPGFSFAITISHILLIGLISQTEAEVLRLFGWLTVVVQTLLLAILIRLLVLVV